MRGVALGLLRENHGILSLVLLANSADNASPMQNLPFNLPFIKPEQAQLAHLAAQLVREAGLELSEARAAAAAQMGLGRHAPLPPLVAVLAEAQTQQRLFEPDAAQVLLGLRQLALRWMEQLADFAPLLRGNVCLGLANRHSSVHLDLYAQSSKEIEIFLINQGVAYETPDSGEREDRALLRCHDIAPPLRQALPIYLHCHPLHLRRGAAHTRLEPGSSLHLRADSDTLRSIMAV